jgi:hypothetical protein
MHPYEHFQQYHSLVDSLLLPSLLILLPLHELTHLFYLLGDPSFGDRGANVHPLSSLASDQLSIPCCLTLPEDTPWLILHVYRDDITTSATLSDTVSTGQYL